MNSRVTVFPLVVSIEQSPYLLAKEFQNGVISHLTLIWSPWSHFNTGIEYMVGNKRNQHDKSGTAHRLQIMAKYIF